MTYETKPRIRWKALIVRKLVVIAAVIAGSYVIEFLTGRSHILGKSSDMIVTILIEHFFFGVPVD